MLSGHQREKLHAALLEGFEIPDLVRFLDFKLDRRGVTLERADETTVVYELILRADREGWMCKLLEATERHHPNPAVRTTARDLHQEACQGNGARVGSDLDDPSRALFVGRFPFVNRRILRENLIEIDGDASAIVVSGPPGSGKTYSWNMVERLCRTRGVRPVYVDLGEYQIPGTCGAEDLMREIAAYMGIPFDYRPEEIAQPARQAVALTHWLAQKLLGESQRWLLMLDGLEQAALDQSAQDLLAKLLKDCARRNLAGLNLMLVGYESEILDPTLYVLEERLAPIHAPELREFFGDLAQQRGVDIDGDAVEAATRAVLDDLQDERLLHRRIADVVHRVFDAEAPA